ncbi:hypothetical protein BB934_37990 (plasmid) [Microvirga ossetica]|uniref:IclR family transcriptional regulator n=1 Tax=Microvirga ossetica TaxID=1882682 RepID=A0A1B2EVS6_9HYPH|nr:IclR family transcriptional regulator C-terminal domain-containing protein [Microvirga ossetica]ANY84054.1 hypothetical protein BB934_37990 [Microvirga ossetica]
MSWYFIELFFLRVESDFRTCLEIHSIISLISIMRLGESAFCKSVRSGSHNMVKSPEPTDAMDATWNGHELPSRRPVPGAALIGKAFRLIDVIGSAPGLVTVPELVKATGWPRPTLYRILAAITAHGFVRFDPVAQGYTLGYKFLELAQNVWAAPDLVSIASIELQRLRNMTGETAYLAVPSDDAMVGLGKFEGLHAVRSAAQLGIRKPMHCTSQGKAVLAHLSEAEVDRLLGRSALQRFTANTMTDPTLLKAQLSIVRQRGYSVEDEEIIVGNRCVGAPILDSRGRPVAAISVAGPAWRLTRERVEQLGPEIASVARNISLQLPNSTEAPVSNPNNPLVYPAGREATFYGADPSWDPRRGVLHWVDRLGPLVFETAEAASRAFQPKPEAPIDAASFRDGTMLVILANRQLKIKDGTCIASQSLNVETQIMALTAGTDGQFWAAGVDAAGSRIGSVTKAGQIEPIWTVAAQVQALAWAPNGRTLYGADPSKGTIYALQTGNRTPKILSRIPRVSGEPRGLAVDASGRLWVALYDGWSIVRLSPEGEFDRVLGLPVPRPTGIAFGGPDGQSIFITTARGGLTRDMLDNAPLSGRLLVARPGSASQHLNAETSQSSAGTKART